MEFTLSLNKGWSVNTFMKVGLNFDIFCHRKGKSLGPKEKNGKERSWPNNS